MSAIEEEENALKTYRDYYDGDQGVELTDRQEEYLAEAVTSFGNICKRAVHIPADRLRIPEGGIVPIDKNSQAYADEARKWWSDITEADEGNDTDAFGLQPEIYKASCRDKAVGVIVGWDDNLEKPTFMPNLLYDGDTGLIRFHYDDNNKLLFASKRWTVWNPLKAGETGKRRLTIYTDGYIERFESDPNTAGGWRQMTPEEVGLPNPQPWTENGELNGIPLGCAVIPFENPSGSELEDIVSLQQVLNHNLGTFDTSIDYHGFPIFYTVAGDFPLDSSGNAEIPNYQPGMAINLVEGGSAGRIEAADLQKLFESGVMSWVQIIALVKGWPMWLFDRNQQPPSGIALQQMERSLVEQIRTKQNAFSSAWRKVFNLARKLHKQQTAQDLPGQIRFEWEPAHTVDPVADMEAKQKEFEAGQYPIVTRWRLLGKSDEEIAQMLEDKRREDDLGLADLTLGIEQ